MNRHVRKRIEDEKQKEFQVKFYGTILIVFLIIMLFGDKAEASECSLSGQQQSILHLSASLGEPHNLSETMVAIAMKESNLGKWNIALGENSFGPWHVRVIHAVKDLGWKNTPFNRNRAAQMMLDNPIYSGGLAVRELVWWRDYHKGDWAKAVRGYNSGHSGGGQGYLKDIRQNIHKIRQCGWLDR